MSRTSLPALIEGLKHLRAQFLFRTKLRSHQSGSTATQMSVEKARDYVLTVAEDYITYGANGDSECLSGKDVLEVGPGDNLGVAMVLLAKGARTVTAVDGFAPGADSQHNNRVYSSIYAALQPQERERIKDIVSVQPDGIAVRLDGRLISRYNTPIDAGDAVFKSNQFDVILSRAVLEHLADLEAGWKAMVNWLRPNGAMWHKVDFRCHNLFGRIHPLYFLTIGQPVWDWVSRPDPTLNRMRLPVYKELLARYFLESRIYFTHIVGQEEEILPHVERLQADVHYGPKHLEQVQSIRPSLQESFSKHSDEELLVEGIFLSAKGVRGN